VEQSHLEKPGVSRETPFFGSQEGQKAAIMLIRCPRQGNQKSGRWLQD
jgi:hypothetical protein